MDIKAIANAGTLSEIGQTIKLLAEQGTPESIELLADFLLFPENLSIYKDMVSSTVCYYLVSLGSAGINAIGRRLKEKASVTFVNSMLLALLFASEGELPYVMEFTEPSFSINKLNNTVSAEDSRLAKEVLTDFIFDCQTDPYSYFYLSMFIGQTSLYDGIFRRKGSSELEMNAVVLNILLEASIKISRQLIAEFEQLITGNHSEELISSF